MRPTQELSRVSRKEKLLERLLAKSADFTWAEAVALMKQHGFDLLTGKGSSRKFVHRETRVKVFIHEPHPGNIVKEYAQDNLLEGLRNVGAIK
jgi:predicted RNA binding protein YcfA (HicA-like mRNA interferase family)